MIREIVLLTSEECQRVCHDVHALRSYWIQRHPILPTYTLGASIGNDHDYATYAPAVQRLNPLLKEAFGWLYERLAERLEAACDAPFTLTERFGCPGFVLYIAPPLLPRMKAPAMPPIHRDLQFKHLHWHADYRHVDLHSAMSCTASLSLPKSGSGLFWWMLSESERAAAGLEQDPSAGEIVKIAKPQYYEYCLGNMVILPNQLPHRAGLLEFEGGDERITLQVHCVHADGAWRMYL